MRVRRPSPSLVVAGVAVVIASTGSAVAAQQITSKQIRDRTIKLQDISKRARGQLTGQHGPVGPAGPAGPQGPAGPIGADAAAKVTYVEGPLLEMFDRAHPTTKEFGVYAICPDGQAPTGGGVDAYTADVDATGNVVSGTEAGDPNLVVTLDVPIDDRPGGPGDGNPSGWGVNIYNDGALPPVGRGDFAFGWAVCVPATVQPAPTANALKSATSDAARRSPRRAPAPFRRGR